MIGDDEGWVRAYAQQGPADGVPARGVGDIEELTDAIQDDYVRYIYPVELVRQDEPGRPRPQRVRTSRAEDAAEPSAAPQAKKRQGPQQRSLRGSGKKYKKCHGALG